jgi:hypothetical protein
VVVEHQEVRQQELLEDLVFLVVLRQDYLVQLQLLGGCGTAGQGNDGGAQVKHHRSVHLLEIEQVAEAVVELVLLVEMHYVVDVQVLQVQVVTVEQV